MIGLGKLGLPCAEAMAQHHRVRGYDVNPDVRSDVIQVCQSHWMACEHADIVFVAVPTPHDQGYGGEQPTSHLPARDFDYSHVRSALQSVQQHAPREALIVLISTVLPGTLRPMITQMGLEARLCYNPYLIAMGTVQDDFLSPDCVMMGFDHVRARSSLADRLQECYRPMWRNSPHIVQGTWEECEAIKIFHNTYITAKITIANTIQDVTQEIGHANPTTIADALAHCDRVTSARYLQPGMGDGGPCHPRDNIALSWLSDQLNLGYDLFGDLMRHREQQARRMADHMMRRDLPIVIWGRAFKPGVALRDGSPAELVAAYIQRAGRSVTWDSVLSEPAHYLMAHPSEALPVAVGSVIVDPHRQWPREVQDITVEWYGVPINPTKRI